MIDENNQQQILDTLSRIERGQSTLAEIVNSINLRVTSLEVREVEREKARAEMDRNRLENTSRGVHWTTLVITLIGSTIFGLMSRLILK